MSGRALAEQGFGSKMFSPAKGFYMTPGLGEDEIRIACVLNAHDLERGAELIRLGLEQYLPRHSR